MTARHAGGGGGAGDRGYSLGMSRMGISHISRETTVWWHLCTASSICVEPGRRCVGNMLDWKES